MLSQIAQHPIHLKAHSFNISKVLPNKTCLMAQWSNLPHDLLVSIAKLLLFLEDFTAFGAVCRSWKLAAMKENFTRTSHQVPLIMLPEGEGTTIREFYNLKKGKIHKLNLPASAKEKLCYSSLGWLMTQSDKDSKVNLLHPLNHAQVELPDLEIFKQSHPFHLLRNLSKVFGNFIVRKFVLSSSPSLTSDYIVMIHSWGKIAYWRPGYQEWTILDDAVDGSGIICNRYVDINYHKGQFYAVNSSGHVFVCDMEEPKKAEMRLVVPRRIPFAFIGVANIEKQYLVESAGTLLVVSSFFEETTRFRVFEVPFSNGNWRDSEVKNLGNRSLFLGYNSSFSIEASDYSGCKANCIYFTNRVPEWGRQEDERKDMGIFNMEDGNIEPLLGKSPNFPTPHLWVEPSF